MMLGFLAGGPRWMMLPYFGTRKHGVGGRIWRESGVVRSSVGLCKVTCSCSIQEEPRREASEHVNLSSRGCQGPRLHL